MNLNKIEKNLKKLPYDAFIIYADELLESAFDEFVECKNVDKLYTLFNLICNVYKKFKLDTDEFIADSIYKLFHPLLHEISNDTYYALKPQISKFLEKTLISENAFLLLFYSCYFDINNILEDTSEVKIFPGIGEVDLKKFDSFLLKIGKNLESKTNYYKKNVIKKNENIDEFLKYKFNTKVYYKLADFINLISSFLGNYLDIFSLILYKYKNI